MKKLLFAFAFLLIPFAAAFAQKELVLEAKDFPAGVTTITNKTIPKVKKYTKIIIPEGVTKIEEEAFKGCKKLQEIKLPSTLKTVKTRAFKDCKSLKSLDLQMVELLFHDVWENCESLKDLYLNVNEVYQWKAPEYEVIPQSLYFFPEETTFSGVNLYVSSENGPVHVCTFNDREGLEQGIKKVPSAIQALATAQKLKAEEEARKAAEEARKAAEEARKAAELKKQQALEAAKPIILEKYKQTFDRSLRQNKGQLIPVNLYELRDKISVEEGDTIRLDKLEIPEGITEIGYEGAGGASYLQVDTLVLPSTIKKLSYNFFHASSNKVIIFNSTKEFNWWEFGGVKSQVITPKGIVDFSREGRLKAYQQHKATKVKGVIKRFKVTDNYVNKYVNGVRVDVDFSCEGLTDIFYEYGAITVRIIGQDGSELKGQDEFYFGEEISSRSNSVAYFFPDTRFSGNSGINTYTVEVKLWLKRQGEFYDHEKKIYSDFPATKKTILRKRIW